MDQKAIIDANRKLTDKIDRLEKENQQLYEYKNAYHELLEKNKLLRGMLKDKHKVDRIIGKKQEDGEEEYFNLNITKVVNSDNGLYIEVILP